MEATDYPSYFQVGDKLAIDSQKNYLRILKLKIVFLLMIALVSVLYGIFSPNLKHFSYVILFMMVFLTLFLTFIEFTKKYDRLWFTCRSIAESTKIETWRFMMRTSRYKGNDLKSEMLFIKKLRSILEMQEKSYLDEFNTHLSSAFFISDKMKGVRNMGLDERKTFYLEHRLNDQKDWYSRKSKWNQKQENLWFYLYWITMWASVIVVFIIFVENMTSLNPVGIICTAAAGMLTWSQTKKFRELYQSYGLISNELSILQEKMQHVSNEKQMRIIIEQVEHTISQEHSVWVTKRL